MSVSLARRTVVLKQSASRIPQEALEAAFRLRRRSKTGPCFPASTSAAVS